MWLKGEEDGGVAGGEGGEEDPGVAEVAVVVEPLEAEVVVVEVAVAEVIRVAVAVGEEGEAGEVVEEEVACKVKLFFGFNNPCAILFRNFVVVKINVKLNSRK